MKLKRKIAIAFVLFSLYSLIEIYRIIDGCPMFPDLKPGSQIAAGLSRFQEISMLTEQKFATLDEIIEAGFGFSLNSKYSLEIADNAAFSQGYVAITYSDICHRKKAPLLSAIFGRKNTPTYTYVSAIFAMPDHQQKMNKILCVGNTPGWQKLPRPYLKNGKPICC